MNIRLLYRKVHFIAFVVLLIGCFGAFYNVSVKSNLDFIDSAIDRIVAKKKLLELYTEEIKLEGELTSLGAMFPQRLDMRWTMSILNEIAKREGIEIVTIRPMPVINGDFHDELRVSILVECSYHQLGRMIDAIDSTDKYIQIEELKSVPVLKRNNTAKVKDNVVIIGWQITFVSIVPKV